MANEHDERIAQIKARLDARTKGEWSRYHEPQLPDSRYAIQSAFEALKPEVGQQLKALVPVAYFVIESDAAFITNAPADMDYLLERIVTLEAQLERRAGYGCGAGGYVAGVI